MDQVFLLAVILSGAFALSIILKKKIEESIPNWVLLMIFILYIFGLFGALQIGIYFILALSVLSVILSIIFFFKQPSDAIKNILTPGLVCFVLLAFAAWNGQAVRMMTQWDEFSHWGLAVKNMFHFDAFYNHPDAVISFPAYPPASALFQYFTCKIMGAFQESFLYQSTNYLYFSMAIYLFKDVKWRDEGRIILTLVLIVLLPTLIFKDFFFLIYVDGILGIFFAYILIKHFTSTFKLYDMLALCLALFVLTITKSSGAGLAIIAVFIIYADMFYTRRRRVLEFLKFSDKKRKAKKILLTIAPLLSVLFAKYSWAIYLAFSNTKGRWDTSGFSLGNFFAVITGNGQEYQTLTISNFITAIFHRVISDNALINLSFAALSALLFCLPLLLIYLFVKKKERTRLILPQSLLFIGAIVYAMSLLILYLFTFWEIEAVNLASFHRYMSTYILGTLFYTISILLIKSYHFDSKKILKYITAAIIIILSVINFILGNDTSIMSPPSIAYTQHFRAPYNPIKQINTVVKKDDKVFFIAQGTSGLSYFVSRYTAFPAEIDVVPYAYSLGDPRDADDIWTKKVTVEEWKSTLIAEYDYVYIYESDDIFDAEFGILFENGKPLEGTLYIVNNIADDDFLKAVTLE